MLFFFHQVIHLVLALASCDAHGIVNGTIAFASSGYIQMRCQITLLVM